MSKLKFKISLHKVTEQKSVFKMHPKDIVKEVVFIRKCARKSFKNGYKINVVSNLAITTTQKKRTILRGSRSSRDKPYEIRVIGKYSQNSLKVLHKLNLTEESLEYLSIKEVKEIIEKIKNYKKS